MTATPPANPPAPEAADLARVRELLPWHTRGALEGADQAFMQSWLHRHPQLPADIEAELAWLQSTERLVREDDAQRAGDASQVALADEGLALLMAHIAADRNPRQTSAPAVLASPGNAGKGRSNTPRAGFWQRLREGASAVFAPRAPAFALGVVAIALVQAAVIGTLLSRESAQQVPLTGEPGIFVAANMAVFTLAFKPQADEQSIRDLLNRAGAQIVAGPTSLGLYRIAVPREGAAAAIAAFAAAHAVVESVQRDR
jgi:hypothetical protein